MFGLRGQEIIIIGLIVALLFGAKRLPELFRSIGEGVRELKKAANGSDDDTKDNS